ncbi:MAG: hypothetical protein ACR2PZ_03910, partial [Pseudomonadales bacterium]
MNRMRLLGWMGFVPIALLLLASVAILASPALQRWGIERYVSAATGKSFTLGTELQLSVGRLLSITANDLQLVDSGATLFAAERLLIEVEPQSIFAGPLVVRRLAMVDVRFEYVVDLETGISNWQGDRADESNLDLLALSRRFVLKDVDVDGLALRYGEGWLAQPRALLMEELAFQEYNSGYADLEFKGDWAGYPVEGSGRLVFPGGILERSVFEEGLDVTIGPYSIQTAGEVSDVLSGTAVVSYSMQGPDVGEFLERVGLPVIVSGAVDVEGRVLTGAGENRIEINGAVGRLAVKGWASAADLETLSDLAIELDASGPDLSAIGHLVGIDLLPATAFEFIARIDTQAGICQARQLTLRTAGASLTATGTWRDTLPPTAVDLAVDFQAPDVSALLPAANRIAALQIPASFAGRFHSDDMASIPSDISGTLGDYEFTSSALIHTNPAVELILDLQVLGDGTPQLDRLAPDHRLTAVRVELEAELLITTEQFHVNKVTASVGEHQLRMLNPLVLDAGWAQTRIPVEARGPSLQQLGYAFAPVAIPYRILGEVGYADGDWYIEDPKATVGEHKIALDGLLRGNRAVTGALHASGDDLGVWFDLVDRFTRPVAYELRASLAYSAEELRIKQLSLTVEEGEVQVAGKLADLTGSGLAFETQGESLSRVAQLMGWSPLVNVPFKLQGRITNHDDEYGVTVLDGRFGSNDLAGSISAEAIPTGSYPWRISADLRSERLDLDELLALREPVSETATQLQQSSERQARLIPQFDLPRLAGVPIDLDWKVRDFRLRDQDAHNVRAHFRSNGNTWQLNPIRLELGPGTLDASLVVEERAEGSFVELA